MDIQQFYFLYVSCNSIAEIAFRQAAEQMLRDLESQPLSEPVTLSPEELDAKLEADFANMDLSALDGINFDFFSAPGEGAAPEGISGAEAGAELASLPPMNWSEQPPGSDDEGELNLDIYMSRAYDHEALLRERMQRHYQSTDLPALDALLAKLPPELPPLTQRLVADEISQWLTLYRNDDETLTTLVVSIRQLDTGG